MEEAFAISESIRKGKGISSSQLKLMKDNNVPQWYIDSAKKMTYIFPKAHATAYVLMSGKIAWYKRYHTLAFFAVFFTLRRDDFDYSLLVKNDIEAVKAKYLVERRNEDGHFQSLEDFSKRAKLNRTVIQKLKEFNVIPPEWAVI